MTMLPMRNRSNPDLGLFNPGQYGDLIAQTNANAGMTAPLPGSTIAPASAAQPNQPFVWVAGGRRLTPEQIAADREIAASLMKSDYSPIRSVWQGLARASDNIIGALMESDARKADAANADADARITQALMSSSATDATQRAMAALVDPYASKQVQTLAKMQYDRLNPKPTAPIFRDDNAGNTWQFDPATARWNMSRIDPIAKMYIQGDQAVQIPNPFAADTAPPAPMGTDLPPGWTIDTASQPDPSIPLGSPLDPNLGRH